MRIRGTALAPGVSANRRKYTADAIAKATGRIQARLKAGEVVPMRSHHGGGDDQPAVRQGRDREAVALH